MRNAIIIVFTLLSLNCFSQSGAATYNGATYNPANFQNIHFQNRPLGFMTQLAPPPPRVNGTFYIYDEWNRAEIFLNDSSKLSDIPVKIDLKENLIEIQYNNSIRVLPIAKILAVNLKTSGGAETFINGGLINSPGHIFRNQPLQILQEGVVMLLCHLHPEVIHATTNPNPMLDVGNKEDKIVIIRNYLIVKGMDIVAVGNNKSAFRNEMTKVFGSDIEPMLKNTNSKKTEDLIALVTQLNEKFK